MADASASLLRFGRSAFILWVMPGAAEPGRLVTWLATLSDLARLRLLRLLEKSELSVGELARALQLPQSTVSRHLKALHDAQWCAKRAEGTASLYSLSAQAPGDHARNLWELSRNEMQSDATLSRTLQQDDARLAEVLAERRTDSRSFFGRLGGEWDHLRRGLFGEQFTAEALLGLLSPDWVVADIGTGTGNAAELLAPYVKKVIAIDREPAMLEAARKRLAGLKNIEFRRGEADHLPLDPAEVHAAVVFLLLHHIADPVSAVKDMARTLRPGGTLMIVDMVSHDREEYRRTMGHQHLGFDQKTVLAWSKAAHMNEARYHPLRPDTEGRGPNLFVATMRKPKA